MADDATISGGDDPQDVSARKHKKYVDPPGTIDLPIAPYVPPPGTGSIAPPESSAGLFEAKPPQSEKIGDDGAASFDLETGRVTGGAPHHAAHGRPSHTGRAQHPGHVFTGKGAVERFAEKLQESVAENEPAPAAAAPGEDAAAPDTTAGQSVEAGGSIDPVPTPFSQDLPPAWWTGPMPPPPPAKKPPRAKKPPAGPNLQDPSIEGPHRLKPAPLAVPQAPPGPSFVDFAAGNDDAGAADAGDDIGVAAGTATAPRRAPTQSAGAGASSFADPLREARDLLAAFSQAVEKLSQAADKLGAGSSGSDVGRLDV